MNELRDMAASLWPNSTANQDAVIKKLAECGVVNLAGLRQSIQTSAPCPSPLSLAACINTHPPMLNHLIVQQSNGRQFKTDTLLKMLAYIELAVSLFSFFLFFML
jgi:hypothetical protein